MLSQMSNMFFPICSFVISLFLFLLLIFKKNVKNNETKIYKWLVVVELIEAFLYLNVTFLVDFVYDGTGDIFYMWYNKILGYTYIILMTLLTYYFFIITTEDNSENITKKNKVLKLLIFIDLLFLFAVLISPISVYYDPKTHVSNSYGIAINIVYGACLFYLIFMILILFKNIKKTIIQKKFLPCYILILLNLISLVIRAVDPYFNITSNIFSFVLLIMYHTIENPDVKMIEQLEIAKNQADKANRAKTDFLSSMSHEIRTPLNAIVGFSEYIESATTLEEAKENASDVVKASQTLLEIVNGILDISKIEAGKIEITNSNYDTHELFDSTIKLAKARLGDKNLDFRIHIAEDIPETLYGDKMNLKKVMINLLTNAIKYTDEGYFDFKVHCIKTNDICRLIISVEDSGRGIKPEDIDKLFTKFTRMDEDRNTTIEGTGLGLAITKQLVELMNGKIVVQSVYGKGSKFTVALDQRISNEVVKEEKVVEQKLNLTGHKVLVVDDNKLNLKVANKILCQYNLTVELVESGQECIDLIKNGNKYDLILMDDMMPVMRGEEVMKKLREIPNFNIPIISLTANAISGMREKYINLGFDEFLSKPIEKTELHRILFKFVANKKIETNNIETKEEIIDLEEKTYLDLSNKKILIVDDNKLNIKVESKVLEKYNPIIESVLSGQECIDLIKNGNTYDLILMDDMMPEMSGVETFHYLKENIPVFNIPVIMVTANAIEGMKDKYLSEGFDAYIAKPVNKELLDQELNKIFKKKTN